LVSHAFREKVDRNLLFDAARFRENCFCAVFTYVIFTPTWEGVKRFFAGFSKARGSETVNETIKHKKGKGDAVQVAHSVMQYVIALAEKPVAPPKSVRQVLPNSKRGR
jgi:hypothetical protein